MKIMSAILVILFSANLTSCGWLGLKDRTNDYLLSEETEPTVIPRELSTGSLGQLYPIPAIETSSEQLVSFDVPRPLPASVNTFEQLVKIQSFDEGRWVLINISPSELWPRLRNVLNRNGVPSAVAQGSSGLIETVWVTFSSDDDNSHRFRFTIAPGVQVESTEIAVVHNQAVRGEEDNAAWSSASDSDQRELDMLTLVANDLAGVNDFASVSLLAQDIGGASKVEIISPEIADPFIRIKLGFDRSWASVVYSLERGGFSTIDKNRSDGLFYVNYTEPSNTEVGFFGRMFGGSDDGDIVETNYRVLVEAVGSNVEVKIVDDSGDSVARSEASRLLAILRSNLS
ncbi:MAG: Outer membrane protein assembly factor BamC [Porticoccaceae bacterium UBA1117]|jgi:outer membrane protein assembly factor BamC|nr:MAG: Outer membrane protein assembly factor BamC [Porticoccaceae bacterium UBA1117]